METSIDAPPAHTSPFLPMFERFRTELDEHHDRRDRTIKATRDITASSKKIIFALQRIRDLKKPIPQYISKTIAPHVRTIESAFKAIEPDLRSINAFRYARQVTGGIQEYMEAVLFQYYLETQTLLPFEDAAKQLDQLLMSNGSNAMPSNAGAEHNPTEKHDEAMPDAEPTPDTSPEPLLTPYDYLLGLFDMTGEAMRFAITSMATSAFVPSSSISEPSQRPRTTLIDLQLLRTRLEVLNYDYKSDGRFARDAEAKMRVTRASVEKVERALYGLVVRGSERPEGWVPDLRDAAGEEVEAY